MLLSLVIPATYLEDFGNTLTHMVCAGYGQTGPYREAAGYDVIIEGEAGLMHMLESGPYPGKYRVNGLIARENRIVHHRK